MALGDIEGAHVGIAREQPAAVIDDHHVAANLQLPREYHPAAVGGLHGRAHDDADIRAAMVTRWP